MRKQVAIEFRIKPELRERCACKAFDNQFQWQKYETMLVDEERDVTSLLPPEERIFEFRIKGRQ